MAIAYYGLWLGNQSKLYYSHLVRKLHITGCGSAIKASFMALTLHRNS